MQLALVASWWLVLVVKTSAPVGRSLYIARLGSRQITKLLHAQHLETSMLADRAKRREFFCGMY